MWVFAVGWLQTRLGHHGYPANLAHTTSPLLKSMTSEIRQNIIYKKAGINLSHYHLYQPLSPSALTRNFFWKMIQTLRRAHYTVNLYQSDRDKQHSILWSSRHFSNTFAICYCYSVRWWKWYIETSQSLEPVQYIAIYWVIQRSWFARVNALCNLSRKKSREVAEHFGANFWVGVASRCV